MRGTGRRPSEDEDYAESSIVCLLFHSHTDPDSEMDVEGVELVDEEMHDCAKLLSDLMAHHLAPPFNVPVDWQGFGLFTYPQLIKKPMDLGTIRDMLKHNTLENPEHFAVHVRLVFQNAQTFNLEGSDIYNSATALLELFEQQFQDLIQRWKQQAEQGTTKESSAAPGPSNEEKEEIDALAKAVDDLKHAVNDLKQNINDLKKSQKQVPNNVKRVRLTRPKAPLSYKQKEEICKKMSELDEDSLPGLLEIIRPGGQNDNEEVEINIEDMDDPTLLKISKYINRCKKSNTKKK